MPGYYTTDHFQLLRKWKDQRKDPSNSEQQRAYDELAKAYRVTEAWADELKNRVFPTGRVSILKKPTNQASKFSSYNWAKVYPYAEAPEELAYTVGIDGDEGFIVKIDTVRLDKSASARKAYLSLRGAFDNTSPFVAKLTAAEGLRLSLDQLVSWSADAIRKFRLSYDEVAKKLGLSNSPTDEELLRHFDGKPEFKAFRGSWSEKDKALFCRLARAVHGAGLDWWHIDMGTQVRFGRKQPGALQAISVLGIIRGTGVRTISWKRPIGDAPALNREPLTEAVVSRIEGALAVEPELVDELFKLETERPGLWPDQLTDDPPEQAIKEDDPEASKDSLGPAPVNCIYYGPPGTGKTYAVSKLIRERYEQATSASAPEDWRNQFIAERVASRKWWEGAVMALYDLDGNASVSQILDHPFIKAIAEAKGRDDNLRQTMWTTLQERTVDESTTVKQKVRLSPQVFDKDEHSIWRFTGDWKEACADLLALVDEYRAGAQSSEIIRRHSFVTFHQSYGYEEFVEGLRPVLEGDADAGEVQYEIRPGVFKELCRKARLAPNERFAMVIDEINRGNISKIFGELITLIESDKREGADNATSVILPYSREAFSVPANVDIIGTMNTADRSLALLDTALRRRFEFVAVLPDARDESNAPLHGLRVTVNDQVIDVPRMLQAINERVEALYDRDHCIGHAYFTELLKVPDGRERLAALAQVFKNRVLPLLEEYFFEDWQKIRLVLADNQKTAADMHFVAEGDDHDADLIRLFGRENGMETYVTKRRYTVQSSAFDKPEAYIGIYNTLVT